MTTSPRELELTPDLLEYATAVAIKEARWRCPRRVSYDDVAQNAILQLLAKPPRFDPSRGASEKTLIYTIVQRAVIKFLAVEAREAGRSRQFDEPVGVSEDTEDGVYVDHEPAHHRITKRRAAELTKSGWTMDDVLQYVDSEDSRALCRLVIEYGGNLSAVARQLHVTEGTVRYRLRLLAPKLRAAGFDPFEGGT